MRLLLDTHIWIWSILESTRLSARVLAAIRNPQNELWLSAVSLWEMVILAERSRIQIPGDPLAWARRSIEAWPVQEAVVSHEIALAVHNLGLQVRDPADRLLVATARVMGLTLVTADERLKQTNDCQILPN